MENSSVSRKRRQSDLAVAAGSESLLENQAISLSCTTCKQRKVRCDRLHPACGWCAKNGTPCVYTEKRKPGIKSGFGRELIERLEKLETIVVGNSQAIQALQSQWKTALKENPSAMVDSSGTRSFPDSATTISVGEEPSGTSPLTTELPDYSTAMASVQLHCHLPSSDILQKIVKLYFVNVNSWIPVLDSQHAWSRLFSSGTNQRASEPPILMYAIVAAAIRFLPNDILSEDRKNYYHSCAAQRVTSLTLEVPTVESLESMIILAIDTVSRSNGPKCWAILSAVCTISLKLGLNREKRDSGALTPSNPESGQSISTTGVSIIPERIDPTGEERRRRLFWAAYILDRYSSVSSSFSFNIPTMQVMRRLPSRLEALSTVSPSHTWPSFVSSAHATYFTRSVQEPVAAEPFAYEIELLGIISAIHEFLRRPVNIQSSHDVERWHVEFRKFCIAIDEWKLLLPEEYSNTTNIIAKFTDISSTDPLWLLVYTLYNTTIVRINSAAGYPYRQSPQFSASIRARECCLTAVSNVVELAKFIACNPGKFYKCLGPHFAWMLWVAARLSIVHSFATKTMLTDDIAVLVRTLSGMGEYWSVAQRYSDLLLFVIEEGWLSKIRKRHFNTATDDNPQATPEADADGDEKATMAGAKILSDMRRTASDLDFLLSISKGRRGGVQESSGRLYGTSTEQIDTGAATVNDAASSASMHLQPEAMDPSFFGRVDLNQFSPSHQFDVATIFDWFNWPKQAAANGNITEDMTFLTSSALGDFSDWNLLPEETGVHMDSNSAL